MNFITIIVVSLFPLLLPGSPLSRHLFVFPPRALSSSSLARLCFVLLGTMFHSLKVFHILFVYTQFFPRLLPGALRSARCADFSHSSFSFRSLFLLLSCCLLTLHSFYANNAERSGKANGGMCMKKIAFLRPKNNFACLPAPPAPARAQQRKNKCRSRLKRARERKECIWEKFILFSRSHFLRRLPRHSFRFALFSPARCSFNFIPFFPLFFRALFIMLFNICSTKY